MKPKEYLLQYQAVRHEYEEARNQYIQLREDAESVAGVRYDKERVQTSDQHDLSDIVVSISRAEEHMKNVYMRYLHLMMEIRDTIDSITDARYREILKRRYIEGQSFEEIQIAMGYEAQYIYFLHGQALLCVKIPKS